MDLISVIVPVYQVEPYLDRCVESIVNQTYTNLEIILVDDGSPDNCPPMCDVWAERDSRIRVIHKDNGGLSDARNAGMDVATGEYIGFVDSDDWIAPEMYERLLEAIQRDGSDIAACSVEMIWEDDTPNRMLTKQISCVLDRNEAQAELLAEDKLKQPVWYKLYRNNTIDGIPFEKGKYHEDVFWSYQAVGNARRVSVIDYVGYFYWQRAGSIMGEGYSLKRLDAVEAFCRRCDYMEEHFPEFAGESRVKLWGGCLYHGQMALRYLPTEDRKQALFLLEQAQKQQPLRKRDFAGLKFSRQIWLLSSQLSLSMVCRIRNMMKIGL